MPKAKIGLARHTPFKQICGDPDEVARQWSPLHREEWEGEEGVSNSAEFWAKVGEIRMADGELKYLPKCVQTCGRSFERTCIKHFRRATVFTNEHCEKKLDTEQRRYSHAGSHFTGSLKSARNGNELHDI